MNTPKYNKNQQAVFIDFAKELIQLALASNLTPGQWTALWKFITEAQNEIGQETLLW